MFPRQSSGQTPVLNRMGLDQLKALFDQSMRPGGDTQFDPYAVLSAIRSKTEEAKFAQAQRNMAAMQQNQAQGIGSLAQQIRREADMVQPPVNMARGGIVAFDKGGSLSSEAIEKLRRDNMVTPEVQAQRDQIAAQTRAQRLKTPEAARAKLQQLDRAVAQATEADSKRIFELERRLTTQALRILESQGPVAALRQGVEALLPAANAAVAPSPAIPRQGAATTGVYDGVPSTSLTSVEGFPINAPAREAGQTAKPNVETSQPSRGFFGTIADYFNTPSERRLPILGALISGQVSGSSPVPRTASRSAAPSAATPVSSSPPVTQAPATELDRLRAALTQAREVAARANENLSKFQGIAGVSLRRSKPDEYTAAVNAAKQAEQALRVAKDAYDAAQPLQITEPIYQGAGVPTPRPAAQPAAQPSTQLDTRPAGEGEAILGGTTLGAPNIPAAPAAEQAAPGAAPSAAPAGPSASPVRSVFDTLVDQIAAREQSRGRELENRLSELRTRRGVSDEIAAGQAGIERLMAEQLANEQRMRDERMAEARKLYESRQGELKPDIARVLRNLSSRSGALFESLGEGVEKEEQRIRTGKEESRKELTAAQRESEEAGRNILKLRMLEAQRVQLIRENRQKDVDRIDDQIAELRDKVAGQDIEALKTQADIRLRQAQVEKPSELQERINLMLRNPGLFYKLYPPANQKVATLDILKQMSTNYAALAERVIDPKQKQIYLDQLARVNTLLERFIGGPQLPPEVKAQLREGEVKVFANGQEWTLLNGQPVQVR